jgi:hypothetical protein
VCTQTGSPSTSCIGDAKIASDPRFCPQR